MMSGNGAIKGGGQVKSPVSLEMWLRYQVESIPSIAAKSGHFSARCAAATLRLKLGGALQANLIDAATASDLNDMLEQIGRVEESA